MKQIHSERHKDVYGSPRMHKELLDRGHEVCRSTVEKLMRREGLAASTHGRFRVTTTDSNHSLPVAENTVSIESLIALITERGLGVGSDVHSDTFRMALSGSDYRSVLAKSCGLVDGYGDDNGCVSVRAWRWLWAVAAM